MSVDLKTYRPVGITCEGGQSANLLVKRIKIELPEVKPSISGTSVKWYAKQKGIVVFSGILAKTDGTAPDPVEFLKAPLTLPDLGSPITITISYQGGKTGSLTLANCECTSARIRGQLSSSGSLYVCSGSLAYRFEPEDWGSPGDDWVLNSITAESNRESEEMALHRSGDGIVPGILEYTEWAWTLERSKDIDAGDKTSGDFDGLDAGGEAERIATDNLEFNLIYDNGRNVRSGTAPQPGSEDASGRTWDNSWYKTNRAFSHEYGKLLATETETWQADCPSYPYSVKVLSRDGSKYLEE